MYMGASDLADVSFHDACFSKIKISSVSGGGSVLILRSVSYIGPMTLHRVFQRFWMAPGRLEISRLLGRCIAASHRHLAT